LSIAESATNAAARRASSKFSPIACVRPKQNTEGAQNQHITSHEQAKSTYHTRSTHQPSFRRRPPQNALPQIAEILMSNATSLERQKHIDAVHYQCGIERNSYANGFNHSPYTPQ
jgi:hypothetical protein